MFRNINFIFVLLIFFIVQNSYGQAIDLCSTDKVHKQFLENNPEEKRAIDAANRVLDQLSVSFQKNKRQHKAGAIYTIPVVFHILHENGPENISDEQVHDAIRVVNEDFRRLNPDTTATIDSFKPIAADTEIEFQLARLDPQGKCTNGIDRIYSSEAFNGTDNSKLNQWPRDKYLNIWVVARINSGAAGYAYYPASTQGNNAYRDGIVILNSYVGSIGTGSQNRSRALTHEIGHYLNLAHLWGSTNDPEVPSNCNSDDGVFDTPLTSGHRSCVLGARTCDGTLDNVQNFMEYTYCYNMFTLGQKARMHATLNSSIASRNSLHSQSNLVATGLTGPDLICEADFKASTNFACVNDTVIYLDNSYHNPTTWLWNLEGAVPKRPSGKEVSVQYPQKGVFDAELVVLNATGYAVESKQDFMYIFNNHADYNVENYVQSFEQFSFPQEWLKFKSYFGNEFELTNTVGYESSSSIFIDNFSKGNDKEKFILISPSFDLSALDNPKISFRYAFAIQDASNNDQLKIFSSNDCGKSWSQMFSFSGAPLATAPMTTGVSFIPDTATEWRKFTLPFSSVIKKSENVMVKFEYTSGGGNNFYLDDINVFGTLVGIEENKLRTKVEIFPNPFTDRLSLKIDLAYANLAIVELYDISGKKIKTLHTSNAPIKLGESISFDMSNISNGMFFVRVTADDQSTTFKIVKQ